MYFWRSVLSDAESLFCLVLFLPRYGLEKCCRNILVFFVAPWSFDFYSGSEFCCKFRSYCRIDHNLPSAKSIPGGQLCPLMDSFMNTNSFDIRNVSESTPRVIWHLGGCDQFSNMSEIATKLACRVKIEGPRCHKKDQKNPTPFFKSISRQEKKLEGKSFPHHWESFFRST